MLQKCMMKINIGFCGKKGKIILTRTQSALVDQQIIEVFSLPVVQLRSITARKSLTNGKKRTKSKCAR